MGASTKCGCIGGCLPEPVRLLTEWGALDHAEFEQLERRALCRDHRPGETIFRQGDTPRGVYVIQEGLVGLRKTEADGTNILMRLCGEGDTLGYRAVLAGDVHHAEAQVLKPTKTCLFSREDVQAAIAKRPALGYEFLRRTMRDLNDAEDRFVQSVTLSVRSRVAHLLLVLKERYGEQDESAEVRLDMPISRSDMASMIGVRPESLSRVIKQMSDDGLVRFSGRHVWIHDLPRLSRDAFVGAPDLPKARARP